MLTQEPRAAAKEMRRMRLRGVIPHRLNGWLRLTPPSGGEPRRDRPPPSLAKAFISTPAKAQVLRQGGAHALTWQAFAGKDCP